MKNDDGKTVYRVIAIGYEFPDCAGIMDYNFLDSIGAVITIMDNEGAVDKVKMAGNEVLLRDIYEGDLVYLRDDGTLERCLIEQQSC